MEKQNKKLKLGTYRKNDERKKKTLAGRKKSWVG